MPDTKHDRPKGWPERIALVEKEAAEAVAELKTKVTNAHARIDALSDRLAKMEKPQAPAPEPSVASKP